MKVVVIGGTGRIGALIVGRVRESAHEAIAASPKTGVDTLTGAGLAGALESSEVVIDASNAPPAVDPERFFVDSTRMLLSAAEKAGVRHVVVLSIVGVDRLGDTRYFRGKQLQEEAFRDCGLPFSIVRSTQFTEFIPGIADAATANGVVTLPPILLQPIDAKDAAAAVVRIALGEPVNGVIDIAGPTLFRLDELVARTLAAVNDPRRVVADPSARYFGARVTEGSLVPVTRSAGKPTRR